jgi:predicted extracellular nuclease
LKDYFTFDQLIIYFDEPTLNSNGIFRPMIKTLFFSKYMEGSSNNKAIEIFNPTDNDVSLELYAIPVVINGVASDSVKNIPEIWSFFPDNAIIRSKQKYLIIHPLTSISVIDPKYGDYIPPSGSLQNKNNFPYLFNGNNTNSQYPVNYNGDDGIKLVKLNSITDKNYIKQNGISSLTNVIHSNIGYTVIDTLGDFTRTTANYSQWDVAGVLKATQDRTLIRKPTIVKGNSNWEQSAGTNKLDSEWIVYGQNISSGIYTNDLGLPDIYVGLNWKIGDSSPVIISTVSISIINGLKHTSSYNNLVVTTTGIVTAKQASGFYIQDGTNNTLGSCGLFIYTGTISNYLSMISVGDLIEITGTIVEYGFTNALTITELSQITNLIIKSSNNSLPSPINIGKKYNNVPPLKIDNDNISDFNTATSALDYWENYEAMLVTLDTPKIVGQQRAFGEFSLAIDMDNPSRVYSKYGGIILNKEHENPDIITATNTIIGSTPVFNSFYPGDSITSITGIVSYDYGYFKILPRALSDFGIVTKGEISRDLAAVKGTANPPAFRAKEALNTLSYPHLAIVSTNQLNLTVKVNETRVSDYIRINMKSPEIIFMQEIQDDSGVINDGTVTSDTNLNYFCSLINDSKYSIYSTRNYSFVYVSPENNQDGGVPGGNIRNVIVYNTLNLEVLDHFKIGLPTETDAFSNSRKPLYVKIKYNLTGEIYHLINVHNKSKSGDSSPWGSLQPEVQFTLPQRIKQTTYIKNWISNNLNKTTDNIIISGDFNDYEWSESVKVLDDNTANRFMKNLTNDIPESERYSFYYNGTYHAIEQMIISDKIYTAIKRKNDTTTPNKKDYITYSDVLSTQLWLLSLGESILVDHNPIILRIPL